MVAINDNGQDVAARPGDPDAASNVIALHGIRMSALSATCEDSCNHPVAAATTWTPEARLGFGERFNRSPCVVALTRLRRTNHT